MHYLHLVYLAERRLEVVSASEKAGWAPPSEGAQAEQLDADASLRNGSEFFTDGPFLETKEYLTAG